VYTTLGLQNIVQKFGLQRSKSNLANAIELELAKEQATSLGRAGRKLKTSLEKYNDLLEQSIDVKTEQSLIKEIDNNVWELMLQREFVGFIEGNLQWVKANYVIPAKAIKLLGR
jgi:hypothetical protein